MKTKLGLFQQAVNSSMPHNLIILGVTRGCGYVDPRNMGVRTKVVPLAR
jgi:hypothetical protein